MSFLGGMIELLRQIVASLYLLVSLLQGQPEDLKFGAAQTDIEIINETKTAEANYLSVYKKYKAFPLESFGIYTREADEFVNAKGEKGYQIKLKKTEAGRYWEKSEGVGLNALENTYDWKITGDVPPGIASTTQ